MTLADALKAIKRNYERALTLRWVRDPVAWALYETWKEADESFPEGSGQKRGRCYGQR